MSEGGDDCFPFFFTKKKQPRYDLIDGNRAVITKPKTNKR
jgi:hypothetical protein